MLRNKLSLPHLGPAAAEAGAQGGFNQSTSSVDAGDAQPLGNKPSFLSDLRPGRRRSVRPEDGIVVARFQVWQDLLRLTDDNLAPLHVSVALEVSRDWHAGFTKQTGFIRIERVPSKEAVQGALALHHPHHGLDHAQQDSDKTLQFIMSPPMLWPKLGSAETVRGVIKLKFWNRKVAVTLPETRVLLTYK